jgi:hypothetical protein
MKNTLRRLTPGFALVALAYTQTGCGDKLPKTAPVSGAITYKGKAVPQGSIMFQPEDGTAATGQIKDGHYVLKTFRDGDGAILGKHTVTVISLTDQSGVLPEDRNPLPPAIVPLEYSFPDKSGLHAVVEDRPNVIDFHLK